MKFKVVSVIILILLLCQLNLFSDSFQVPKKAVEINFWSQEWAGGVSWTNEWLIKFADLYPNIKINVIYIPFEELGTKVFPAIAARTEPDLMMVYDDWMLGKDPSKLFTPITPDLYPAETLKKLCFSVALDCFIGSDGKIYGIPFGTGANMAGLLVHKDILDQAGISPKSIKTWDDARNAAKKLTIYKGSAIQRSGISFGWQNVGNLLLDMVAAQGAAEKLLNSQTGEWNFNIPEAKKALDLMNSFVEDRLFDPSAGDVFTAFPNKMIAMLVFDSWGLGAWGDKYPDLKLDFIYMPKIAGTAHNVHTIGVWGALVGAKRLSGDKRNAVLLYMKEVIENPAYFDIAFNKGYWVGVPGSRAYVDNVLSLTAKGKAPSKYSELASMIATNYVPNIKLLPTKISMPELVQSTIFPEVQARFLNRKTDSEVLDYLTRVVTTKEKEKR